MGLIPRASIPVDRRSVALVCGKGLFFPPHTPPAMKTPVCFGGGSLLGDHVQTRRWPRIRSKKLAAAQCPGSRGR